MTYERDAVIAKLIDRARTQIRTGIAHLERGDYVAAESWLRPAIATLDALQAVLDGPQPPLRKLAIVGNELPEWMEKRHGDGDDAA